MVCVLKMASILNLLLLFELVTVPCSTQRNVSLPLSPASFRNILRSFMSVPARRRANIKDVRILHYSPSSTSPTVYFYSNIKKLLSDSSFDLSKPTTIYIHGYIELTSDENVQRVVEAYRKYGGHNLLLLDWSNLAFGNYINVILDLEMVGVSLGKAVVQLLRRGFLLSSLHVVGHSLGAQLAGAACRYLKSKGHIVPRLTGLDPAFPGFYPPIALRPIDANDVSFMDVIHTDGGGFGSPVFEGHASFWPNEGRAKQPGCLPVTVPLTIEDFCSHWRSWRFWSESVEGGRFLARKCDSYDSFVRGDCQDAPLVNMGFHASSELRGNFYLRTAAQSPFALGERGAD